MVLLNYERVIPNNNSKELIVDAQEFIAAVDRVSTYLQIELEL